MFADDILGAEDIRGFFTEDSFDPSIEFSLFQGCRFDKSGESEVSKITFFSDCKGNAKIRAIWALFFFYLPDLGPEEALWNILEYNLHSSLEAL